MVSNTDSSIFYASELQQLVPKKTEPLVYAVVTKKPVSRGAERSKPESSSEYLGVFKVTYYCACEKCCGNVNGITASGAKVSEGVTMATDPNKIKLGATVYVEGVGIRIAQDTGGAIKGNRVDVYVKSHEEALKLGVRQSNVYLIKEATK